METISKIELKEKMQSLYDSYISLANRAFQNAGANIPGALKFDWQSKSEAYQAAANLLDLTLAAAGIFIESKKTEREKFSEQEQREMCAADAECDREPDWSEDFYHN